MNKQYVILSVERRAPNGYFVAFHGYTPFYSSIDKARRFNSKCAAKQYADNELFTSPDASFIEEVSVELPGTPL